MTQDIRPAWTFSGMTESDFRRVLEHGMIKSVTAKWAFTSADTTREWLEATNLSGEVIVLPDNYTKAFEFVGSASLPGLFRLTYTGEQMRKRVEEIDAWEADNASDRVEFERLRKKFGV